MIDFNTVLIVSFWFLMGIGVFNMWKICTGNKLAILVIPFWPLILLVTAVFPRD